MARPIYKPRASRILLEHVRRCAPADFHCARIRNIRRECPPPHPAGLQSRADALPATAAGRARSTPPSMRALLIWLADILGQDGWSVIDVAILVCLRHRRALERARRLQRGDRLLAAASARRPARRGGAFRDGRARRDGRSASRTAIAADHPQRGSRPRFRAPRASMKAESRRDRRGRPLRLVRAQRHERCAIAAPRRARIRRAGAREEARGRAAPPLSSRSDNIGYKAGNIRDFCERLAATLRIHDPARRRQPDGWRHDRTPRAHRRGASAHRHHCRASSSARRRDRPSRGSSNSACATACAPTPWARPGGRAIAAPSGAIMRWCASRLSRALRSAEACAGGAHILSHDQIEAALMRRAGL